MTPAEIQAYLPGALIRFAAAEYAVPSLDWLQGGFWRFFKAQLWADNLDAWKVKWECRDFARGFAYEAAKANALTANSPAGSDAIAVGEFWFIPDGAAPATGHAVNACITDRGLVFIEPQTGLERKMSANEISSCYFARF